MILKLKQCAFISDKHKRKVSIIGGLLLSFSFVMGAFLHYQNRLARTIPEFLFHVLLIILGTIVTGPLMGFLFELCERLTKWMHEYQRHKILKYKSTTVFLATWAFIFACWIPMFLNNWPSNFIFDAKYQIREVLMEGYHTHHPLVHTYLMGLFYRFGMRIGNVSLGFSLYTLLQMLMLSFAMGVVVSYLYKKKIPRVLLVIFTLFYALIPVNAIFSITATKDVCFATFFLLYSVYIFRWFVDEEEFHLLKWTGFVCSGIIMCLLRNNAVFALVAITPFFLIFKKGKRKKMKTALSMILVLVGFALSTFFVGKALHAYNNDAVKESFSVPLQQLARVASYRYDDLDLELYQEITTFIPTENIESYSPYISDGVKNGADENMLQDHMGEFLLLWAKIGVKYPGEYVASFMANTMGFWYLGPTEYEIAEEISTFHTTIGMGEEIEKKDFIPFIGKINQYLYSEMNYKKIPVLRQFFHASFYFWIVLFTILNAIYSKKKKNILGLGLVITYILTLFLGPIVTLRYMYAIIVSIPLIIVLLFYTKNDIDA